MKLPVQVSAGLLVTLQLGLLLVRLEPAEKGNNTYFLETQDPGGFKSIDV